jgi:tetratricopeptide (TPR) repeat protein
MSLAVVTAAVIAGAGWIRARRAEQTALDQRNRAEANLRSALDAVDRFTTFVAQSQMAGIPAAQAAREQLLHDAVDLYKEVTAANPSDSAPLEALTRAANHLYRTQQKSGRSGADAPAGKQNIAWLSDLVARNPGDPTPRRELARALNDQGHYFLDQGDLALSEESHRNALAVKQKLVLDFPAVADYRRDLARGLDELAKFHRATRNAEEALARHMEAVAQYEQLVKDLPNEPEYRRDLARSIEEKAKTLSLLNRTDEAVSAVREAGRIYQALATNYADNPDYPQDYARNLEETGRLLIEQQAMPEALASFAEANRILRAATEQFPSTPWLQQDLARNWAEWASTLNSAGRKPEALRAYSEADRIYRALEQAGGLTPQLRADHAYVLGNWAQLLPPGDGRPRFEEARLMWSSLVQERPDNSTYVKALEWTMGRLAASGVSPAGSPGSEVHRPPPQTDVAEPAQGAGESLTATAPAAETLPEVAALDSYTLRTYVGETAVVRGVPVSVLTDVGKERLTLLRFGNIKHQFCVIIHRSAMPVFEDVFGPGLQGILGREHLFEGLISLFQSTPQMVLNRPEQIREPAAAFNPSPPRRAAVEVQDFSPDDLERLRGIAGETAQVTGRIRDVAGSPSGAFVFINFYSPTGNAAIGVIRKENLEAITRAFEKPLNEQLAGRMVRIQGQVYTTRDKVSIEITSPYQIVLENQ